MTELESKVFSKQILDILYESGKTVSTAESCTGGRIAEALTMLPGSSDYYVGSVVCYATRIKEEILGVDHQLIEEKNVVSEEVAVEMVKGACKVMNTDYAIAVTGLAGPGGGTPELPVGTIWIACGAQDDIRTLRLEGDHGREMNLTRATNEALTLFVEYLKGKFPQPDLSEIPAPEAK